jgi:CHAT domain-containing protein
MLILTLTHAFAASLAECRTQYETAPAERDTWRCVYGAARAGEVAEARTFADGLLAEGTLPAWGHLTRANLLRLTGDPDTMDAYTEAAARMASEEIHRGVVYAWINFAASARAAGELDAAQQALDDATVAAERDGSADLAEQMVLERARHVMAVGGDFASALRDTSALADRIRVSEEPVEYYRHVIALHTLGGLLQRTGQREAAMGVWEELATLADENDDPYTATNTRYNVLNTATFGMVAAEDAGGRTRIERTIAALRRTVPDGDVVHLGYIRCAEAMLPPPGERLEGLLACTRSFDDFDDVERETGMWMALAREHEHLGQHDAADRALDAAAEAAAGWTVRNLDVAQLRTELLDGRGALADAQRIGATLLDGVEELRDRQRDELVQLRTLDAWADAYRCQAHRSMRDDALQAALATIERLRGRQLLQRLDMAGATGALAPTADPLWRAREQTLTRIAAAQLAEEVDPDALAALEREEAEQRQQLYEAHPAYAALRDPAPPALEALQRALEPDEALAVYQIGAGSACGAPGDGRSWVLLVTATTVQAVPLGDDLWADSLADRIGAWAALARTGDPLAARSGASLRQALFAPVEAALPTGTRQLVVVPDTALAELPLAAVAPQHLAVAIAPSSALWLRWRSQPDAAPTAPARILADPTPPDGSALAALPRARDEAHAIAGVLVDPVDVRVGDEATEAAVGAGPSPRLVHLAAHATVDAAHPERSAVHLAASGADDGLLQVREIVGLDLRGSIVVLSACDGARGEVLGEGVYGLSEAFLRAGAKAVVASQWPLRDDEAAALFTELYGHLGEGVALGEALRQTRSARTPGSESLVLVGDPAASIAGQRGSSWAWLAFPVLAVLALGGALLGIRRTRGRP